MATTISVSSTIAVSLSNTADNPVTVTGSGTIDPPGGIALSLQAPIAWTLFNYGLIGVSGASGEAVRLGAGGTIDNKAGGSIIGVAYGAFIAGAAGSVTNAGLVQSKGMLGIALDLGNGGVVGNRAGAKIAGGHGVEIYGTGTLTNGGLISGYATAVYVKSGTVTNDGVITSSNTAGIQLGGAGFVTNAASATIAGGFGVIETLGAAVVDNAGMLAGSTFDGIGVFFSGGGTVSNASGGTISGYLYGVDIENGARSLINAGMVTATGTLNGVAFSTTFGGPGTAYVGNTGSIVGSKGGIGIKGVPGSVDNSGAIEGATGYGVRLESGGNIVNAAGGIIRAANGDIVYIDGAGSVTNAGTIAQIGSALNAVYFRPGYANRLIADPGAVFAGTVNGGNSIGATAVSVLELAAGAGTVTGITNFGSIVFDTGAAWKISGAGTALAGGGLISGFRPGDTIELAGVTASKTALVGDTLQLTGGLELVLPGNTYSYNQFQITNSGGNTDITVACFLAGTRILTAAGEVPVEELRFGDRVPTLSSRLARIAWLGHRRIDCRRHTRPTDAWPIRVRAGAFGERLPARDLMLSPDHAMFVDDVLVPIRHLLNGCTVVQEQADEVVYYHLELTAHDVILAEGLPCESYLDTGNRAAFENGSTAAVAVARA